MGLVTFESGSLAGRAVAWCHAHGAWLDWLAGATNPGLAEAACGWAAPRSWRCEKEVARLVQKGVPGLNKPVAIIE